jgi:hypothetical protein
MNRHILVVFVALGAAASNTAIFEDSQTLQDSELRVRRRTELPDADAVILLGQRELGSAPDKGMLKTKETIASREADIAAAQLVQADTDRSQAEEEAEKKREKMESIKEKEEEAERQAKEAMAEEKTANEGMAAADKEMRAAKTETRQKQQQEAKAEREAAAANRTAVRIQHELKQAEADYKSKHKKLDEAKLMFQNATANRIVAEQKMKEIADELGLSDAAWRTAKHDADSAFKREEGSEHAMFDARMQSSAAMSKANQMKDAMKLAEERSRAAQHAADAAAAAADRMGPIADAAKSGLDEATAAALQLEKDEKEVITMGKHLVGLTHESEEDEAKAKVWSDKASKAHQDAALLVRLAKDASKKRMAEHAAALKAQLKAEKREQDFEKYEDYVAHLADKTKEREAAADIAKTELAKVRTKAKDANAKRKEMEYKVHSFAQTKIPHTESIEKKQAMLLKKKDSVRNAITELHAAIDKEHEMLEELKQAEDGVHSTVPLAEATRTKLDAALIKAKKLEKTKDGKMEASDQLTSESLKVDKKAAGLSEKLENAENEATVDDEKAAEAKDVANAADAKRDELQHEEDDKAKEVVEELKDMAAQDGLSANATSGIEMELRARKIEAKKAASNQHLQRKHKERLVKKLETVSQRVTKMQALKLNAEHTVQQMQEKVNNAASAVARSNATKAMRMAQIKRLETTEALDEIKIAQQSVQAELDAAHAHTTAADEHASASATSAVATQQHLTKAQAVQAAEKAVTALQQSKVDAELALEAVQQKLEAAQTPADKKGAEMKVKQAETDVAIVEKNLAAAKQKQSAAIDAVEAAAKKALDAARLSLMKKAKLLLHAKQEADRLVEEAKAKLTAVPTAQEREAAQAALDEAQQEQAMTYQEWSNAQSEYEVQHQQDVTVEAEEAKATAAEATKVFYSAQRKQKKATAQIAAAKAQMQQTNSTNLKAQEEAKGRLDAAEATARTVQKEFDEAMEAHEKAQTASDSASAIAERVKLSNKIGSLKRQFDEVTTKFKEIQEELEEAKTALQAVGSKEEAAVAKQVISGAMKRRNREAKERNKIHKKLSKAEGEMEKFEDATAERAVMRLIKRLSMMQDEKVRAEAIVVKAQAAVENASNKTATAEAQERLKDAEGDVVEAEKAVEAAKLAYTKGKENARKLKARIEASKAQREVDNAQNELQELTWVQASAVNAVQVAKDKLSNSNTTAAKSESQQILKKARARVREVTTARETAKQAAVKVKTKQETLQIDAAQKAVEKSTQQLLMLQRQENQLLLALKQAQKQVASAATAAAAKMARKLLQTRQEEADAAAAALIKAEKAREKAAVAADTMQKKVSQARVLRLRESVEDAKARLKILEVDKSDVAKAVAQAQKLVSEAKNKDQAMNANRALEEAKVERATTQSALVAGNGKLNSAKSALQREEEKVKDDAEKAAESAMSSALASARVAQADNEAKRAAAATDMKKAQEALAAATNAAERRVAEAQLKLASKWHTEALGKIHGNAMTIKMLGKKLHAAAQAAQLRAEKAKLQKLNNKFEAALAEAIDTASMVKDKHVSLTTAKRAVKAAQSAVNSTSSECTTQNCVEERENAEKKSQGSC